MAKIPFPRFTVRRLMVAAAIVSVGLGLFEWVKHRRTTFELELDRHRHRLKWEVFRWRSTAANPDVQLPPPRYRHEEEMVKKYDYATQYPWMPVLPDPPEPD